MPYTFFSLTLNAATATEGVLAMMSKLSGTDAIVSACDIQTWVSREISLSRVL
jgi:hypothetical protein